MIVVAGEALVDLVGEPDGRYRPVPGGSPANVAVALARLGRQTELLARLGTGRFGRLVRDHLVANGVALTHAIDTDRPTTLALATLDATGRADYDFYVDGTADWGWQRTELPATLPSQATALCVGSLAVAIEPGATALRSFIDDERRRGAVSIVFDPNLRPSLLGPREDTVRTVESLVAASHVVKVSDEDLAWLEPGTQIEALAGRWAGLGPDLVVVTRGGEGAYAVTRSGKEVNVAARQIDLVDTVGAGDAFTAGLVDALTDRGLLGDGSPRLAEVAAAELRAVLDHAGAVAAITCSRRGADPPTRRELDSWLGTPALHPRKHDRHT